MPFRDIRFYNFRNIADAKIPVHHEQVFFVGPNGQGKSNFLEAVYLLAYGRSFRSLKDDVMIRNGESEFSVSGSWLIPGSVGGSESELTVSLKGKKKEIRINGNLISDRKELLDFIPAIVFSHDDIDFVKGPPENQRWFFNQCLSTYKVSFIDLMRSYSRILKTRNLLIRERKLELIELYNVQLIELGLAVMEERRTLVDQFNELFTPLFAEVSGLSEPLRIAYRPSWKSVLSEDIAELLRDRIDTDLRMNTTTSGPHRDRFSFRIGSRDFIPEASTGQLRLMGLLLRAAQARLFAGMSRKKPVLLLDDVLLELDGKKREKFMSQLPEHDQIFFTFLPDEDLNRYISKDSIVYDVNEGRYSERT